MIWLIGCKGMLGMEIARQLTENNMEFAGTGRDVDVTSAQELADFAKGKNISYIINCSAYTAVDKAESDVELAKRLNEAGTRNIATLAKKIHARLIHISTDYVFDGKGTEPYTEESPVAPIGVYGKTKAAGEDAVKQILDEYYIIRTAWLYGWTGRNFVYTMIKAINANSKIKVVNDQKGSPTFAGDLADIIIRIIKKQGVPFGTYHCTDIGEITWWDFANEIKKQGVEFGLIENKDCDIIPCTTEEYPTPAKRPQYSVLNKDKIQKALGITLPLWNDSLSFFLKSGLFDKGRIV